MKNDDSNAFLNHLDYLPNIKCKKYKKNDILINDNNNTINNNDKLKLEIIYLITVLLIKKLKYQWKTT